MARASVGIAPPQGVPNPLRRCSAPHRSQLQAAGSDSVLLHSRQVCIPHRSCANPASAESAPAQRSQSGQRCLHAPPAVLPCNALLCFLYHAFFCIAGHQAYTKRLKEGRKDYICSSRLGLIRWYDRFRSDRRIQQVKAILDKVRYTNDILLPHELLHGASAIHKQSSILVPHT